MIAAAGRIAAAVLATAVLGVAGESSGEAAPEGMALIPAGEFTMGRARETPDDETNMRPLILRDDRPPRTVRLDAFFIDVHEVTHQKYSEFVLATGRRPPYHWLGGEMPENKSEFPIHNVDWGDARAYCAWAGKRLPTEAEWEKAARGGLEGLDYPWGDEPPNAMWARFNTPRGPGPAGRTKPNGHGLYDMAGGVAEWCADWFDRTYYETAPTENPPGPAEGMYKVIRGGAWSDGPRRITVFFRNWVRPNQRAPNIGFRRAKDAPDSARD